MSFSKFDLEKIKNKISLSSEIEKKVPIIKKGKDYWCCCPFHEEKTPSCKINDDIGSYYCFGCGAKGDIFTLYTDLYNYNFQDAVRELSKKLGIEIEEKDNFKNKEINIIKKILIETNNWFIKNLNESSGEVCLNYLKKRKISKITIDQFKLGYSYNSKISLLDYLTNLNFSKKDIIKSNVVKLDKNNKLKDYFYKRLIFPIKDQYSNIIGFGGRALDDSNPKYINSPESNFFQKRFVLYNLDLAKITSRKKNNLLLCEGYMDVISLYQKGIHSVVAPLGTSLTADQLNLAWKFCNKPTIMFDSDQAGLRAAYKSSLLSLSLISAKRFLQFITLPNNYDPDSFINNNSFEDFIEILKKPIPIVDFIFNQASLAFPIRNADDKIVFDKYLDELVGTINDNKIKYFYKSEFKKLFFDKIRSLNIDKKRKNISIKKTSNSVLRIQFLSFIASYINHHKIRSEIKKELIDSNILEGDVLELFENITDSSMIDQKKEKLVESIKGQKFKEIIKESLKSNIYQLFPYSSESYDDEKALLEIKESCLNLNRRLLNLKKINKSLSSFIDDSNQLNWKELQKINKELFDEI